MNEEMEKDSLTDESEHAATEEGFALPEGTGESAQYSESNTPELEEAGSAEASESGGDEPTDYAELARIDLERLHALFPETASCSNISELDGAIRYAELRDLGLTPEEAYLATRGRPKRQDNRSHLSSAVPRSAGSPAGAMTRSELEGAREIFPGLGDREIARLYRRVSI